MLPALRFAHVAAIRQRLVERGAAPATVNLTLAALLNGISSATVRASAKIAVKSGTGMLSAR